MAAKVYMKKMFIEIFFCTCHQSGTVENKLWLPIMECSADKEIRSSLYIRKDAHNVLLKENEIAKV